LRENRVPWVISEARPAILGMRNESGEKVYIRLQIFRPTSSLRDQCCGICHCEDRDEPVVLKCGRCTTYVHLKCMSLWVQSHRSGSRISCLTWCVKLCVLI
jgi:hypothetical protein